MNIKKLTTTIALGTLLSAASAGAMATNMEFDDKGTQWLNDVMNTKSTLTRAEVKNEIVLARQQGTLDVISATYPVLAESNAAPRSRSAVRKEAIQSVQSGKVPNLYTGG